MTSHLREEDFRRLADEQAALRRVATLVAEGATPAQVFDAVAHEVARLLELPLAGMHRYEPDGTATVVSSTGPMPIGASLTLEGTTTASSEVRRTGRSTIVHGVAGLTGPMAEAVDRAGIETVVGAPIVVDGDLWGLVVASPEGDGPLPPDAERRLSEFTALVATAIANAEARAEVTRLAETQAALRRVATLVAHESPAEEVFAAVAGELQGLLCVSYAAICRYEPDASATVVAHHGEPESAFALGTRLSLEGKNVAGLVLETRRPARVDDYASARGELARHVREIGVRSAIGSPIVVDGGLWGLMIVASTERQPLPTGTEARVGEFTALVAAAISNLQTRSELAASRARIVAAADEERRRVVRDLHDGAQLRLVHTVITLEQAREALRTQAPSAAGLLDEALGHGQVALRELRELAHGILPHALARGGLPTGLRSLAARSPVPVTLDVPAMRFADSVEVTAYFVVAEALTNVAKHAHAGQAWVAVAVDGASLVVEIRDDGVGGAWPEGSRLVGMRDRLAAVDGELFVHSPPDGGTVITATIPLDDWPSELTTAR